MNRMIMLVAALVASTLTLSASEVQFVKPSSWQEALDAAKSQNKYLFVDAYTDWCGWCKVMDQKTFTDAAVADVMNTKFVNVKIEMETGFGIDVAMKYRISSFPQFLIFSPSGTLVYRLYGYRPPEDFLPELDKALDPATQESYPGVSARFDLAYPAFLRGAYLKGKERTNPTVEEVTTWLNGQADPMGEVAWTVMSRCALDEKWEQYVMDHRKDLAARYGEEANQRVYRTIYGRVVNAIQKQDRPAFDAALQMWPEDSGERAQFVSSMELQYLSGGQNWKGLVDKLHELVEADAVAASVVNEHCWNLYEKCDDQAVLTEAVHLMGHVVEGQGWAVWDTYAALQFKTGDLAAAEATATKAIAMGKAAGDNVSGTEELLAKIKAAR